MRYLLILILVQVAVGGHVNVRMPYLNPAGVTYLGGPAAAYASPLFAPHPIETPVTSPFAAAYAGPFAAPLETASAQFTSHAAGGTTTYHGNGRFAPAFLHTHVAPAAPITRIAPAAIVPAVHNVPAVADFPVTRIHAHPGVIHKEVDVAKPAVKTSRFEVRRPAIQKQFYDIEERVVVRPAGSALVELDQPHSKIHKGSVVSPVVPSLVATPVQPIHTIHPVNPTVIAATGSISSTTLRPLSPAGDDDSIVVDARTPSPAFGYSTPQFKISQATSQLDEQLTPHQRLYFQQLLGDSPQLSQNQLARQRNNQQNVQVYNEQREQPAFRQQLSEQQRIDIQQILGSRPQSVSQNNAEFRSSQIQSNIDIRETGNFQEQLARNIGSNVIASTRNQPESSIKDNQERLINLLTARQGIAEINGEARTKNFDEQSFVRSRVLSADVSNQAPIAGEKVNTRRIVVSRPIETVEEVDVVEPVTKLHRLSVQQPAVFKTAHLEVQRLQTSVPVLGKAIAPLYHH